MTDNERGELFKKAAEALHHEAGEALRDRMLAEFHKITSPIIIPDHHP